MDEEKSQQIIVLTDFTERSNIALDHGILLSEVLEKELTIVCLAQEKEDEAALHEKMKAITKTKNTVADTKVLKGKFTVTFNEMVPEINAVLVIVCFNNADKKSDFHPARLLKMFRASRIPYLFVNKAITSSSLYKKIILPIDASKETKEKVLWASYFGRFNEAEIKVMIPTAKDEYLLRYLSNNLKFIKKIFKNLDVKYNVLNTSEKLEKIDEAAIITAAEENAGLVIILSTKSYGMIDLLKGPRELALITNQQQVSVMCLNQRDDLYVLCD